MEESEDNLSSEDLKSTDSLANVKTKPKKRSLIERELETSLTARITSPVTNCDGTSTSRYGRARRLKSTIDLSDVKKVTSDLKSPLSEKSPLKAQTQSPVYKMHASNSPLKRTESPKKAGIEKFLDDQIESIYHENISLSRFGSEEVNTLTPSPPKRLPKVYIRKDLIQNREPEDTVMVIQNMFSPVKSTKKSSNTHLNNILERSSERYNINSKPQNGYLDNSSVVKTLDFDGKRKKKEIKDVKGAPSKSELFELEANCTYQVGDLAWARMGTYPFWPSIVTRDPSSGVFVKKKLFGRIERDVIHVTFFGDNGRRGWIVDSMLRKYLGQLEFEATRENFTPEAKKKDPRLYAAFFVSEKKQALWNNSVEEAEMLLREPKRLRIDIFNDMLVKSRSSKVKQPKSKISRTDSDVSLSESLYDSLFSEDDGKTDNNDRSRNRSRNKSLDMFEVVTACLDNMAAKTGITKIQKQSHMDRWLQKAKSKTPEKTKAKTQVPSKKSEEKKETVVKSTKRKKSASTKRSRPVKKDYSLRKSSECQSLQLPQNEHNSSINSQDGNITDSDQTSTDTDSYKHNSTGVNGIGIISKVESLAGKETENIDSEKLEITNESATSESPKESSEDINGTCDSETYTDDESQDCDIAPINNTTDEEKPVLEEFNAELTAKDNNDSELSSVSKAVSNDKESETNNDIENQNSIPEHSGNTDSNAEKIESQGDVKESSDKVLDSEPDTIIEDNNSKVSDTETDNLLADDNSKVIGDLSEKDNSDKRLDSKTGNLTEDDITKVLDSETDNLIEDNSDKILGSTDNKFEEDTSALSTPLSKVDSEMSNTIKSQDNTEETTNTTEREDNTEESTNTTEREDNTVETSNTTDSQDNIVSSLAEESNKINLTNEEIENRRNIESNIEIHVSQNTSKKTEEVRDIDLNKQEYEESSVNKIQDDKETLNIDENDGDMSLDDDSDSEPLPYSPLSNLGNNSDDNLSLDDVPFVNDLKKPVNDAENKVDSVDHLVDDIEIRNNNFNIDVSKKDNQKIVHNSHIFIEDTNARKESILSQILEYKNNYREVSNKNVFDHSIQINTESANENGYRGENVREIEMESKEVRIYVSEKLSEPIKVNGFQERNGDFDLDTASIHSEDSVTSTRSESKRKLRAKQDKKEENPLENTEFVKYMELRQDAIMDENPELTEKEIVAYLHKTWLYEESVKSDVKKNDDLRECNLVKGLNEIQNESPRRAKRNLSLNKRQSNRNTLHKFISRKRDVDVRDMASDDMRSFRRRGVRKNMIKDDDDDEEVYGNQAKHCESPRQLQNVDIPVENVNVNPNLTDVSVKSIISTDIQENDEVKSKETEEFKHQLDATKQLTTSTKNAEEAAKNGELLTGTSDSLTGTLTIEKIKDDFDLDSLDSEDSETPLIRCKLRSKAKNKENDVKEGSLDSKIKDEDADTISIKSEDSEVSVTKRKKRLGNKRYENALEDPEFVKYSELRQDALIEENPQLTQDEITAYLYQTWLYEENTKSDIKKSDEIEQSTLVKGLKDVQDVQPKKIRRKITKTEKAEKETLDDYTPGKEKPKRKSIKPFYNEEYSDIEEELEVFEIFKPKIKEVPKIEPGQSVPEMEVLPEVEVYDEVELYFAELTKPKPNIFKGLIREKVCDICEKTGNLVKCKGCSGMFHVDCVKKQVEITDVPAPTRGRKKKKRVGRKPKNSEEFDNDDKSQDVSEENNVSVDEILEADSHTVDADVLEAQLSAKMKEILDTAETIEYDSYSSDDGLDWSETIPGKCEIIDVKLKPKSNQIDYSDFKCNNCQKYTTPICFVCKGAVSKKETTKRQKCHVAHCHKYYHLECLEQWPQTHFNGGEPSKTNKKIHEYFEALTCPRHVCHTCVSDDPRGCKTRFSGDKLARCVRCPATYHSFTKCLPAGTQILTASHIICPRHYEHRPGKVPCHVNTGWCFICALGGSLICCEYCPTSFHAECLNIDPPEGGYMCEDCETGRLPLYGEMVWVKLGHYRWWPGIILHPYEIPENLMAVKHSLGEFVVRFFGQYDHYWVNRGRVFPFQEGDSGRISSQKSKIDAAFTTAMEHAQRACEILKTAKPNEEESLDIASSLLPPHYVKLKVNKPCGSLCGRKLEDPESSLTQCECNPLEDDPCGPYSQCLNRMLLTECGPTCRAGERCNNRAFEKRLYPKLVPYRTPSRGWGLKTLEDIKAGQFVIEYVGELIDEEETRRRMRRKHEIRDENFYFLTLDKERMIDAGPKGNLARFMNHCCEPNCETQKWTVLGDVRVGLFALFDIPAHSEVTFNYNLECAGIDKKRCMCGAKRCSGYIGAKPKQDESQTKKQKLVAGKRNKKRKPEESPSTKNKSKRPLGRPPKSKELTEIEKDLLIIRNATNGLLSDESSRSLSSESDRNPKAIKRKRVSFSTDEVILYENEPNIKKAKVDDRIEE